MPVALVSLFAALTIAYHVSLVPPRLESRSVERGVASTHLLVDSERSALPDLAIPVEALAGRAQVYAELLRSESVRRRIGEAAGIPWESVAINGSTTDRGEGEGEPASGEPALAPERDQGPRLVYEVDSSQPIIRILARSETVPEAVALVQASFAALSESVEELQLQGGVPAPDRVTLMQVESTKTGTARESPAIAAALVGVALLATGCLLILLVSPQGGSLRSAEAAMARVGRELRPKRPRMESAAPAKAGPVTPAATGPRSRSARAPGRAAKPAKARPRAGGAAARAGAGRARLRLPRFGVRSPVWAAGVVLPIVVALLALDGPAVEPAADPSLDRPGAVTVTDSPGPPGAPLALHPRESAGSGPRLVTLGGVPPRSRDEGRGGGANGEVDGAPNKGAPAPPPAPAPAPGGGGGGGSDGGGGGGGGGTGDGGGDGAGGGSPPPPAPAPPPPDRPAQAIGETVGAITDTLGQIVPGILRTEVP